MYVHAVTGFLEKWLSHKGGVDSMFHGNRAHDVLEVDGRIRHLQEWPVPKIDLSLARAVLDIPGFNFNPCFTQRFANIVHEVVHLSAARNRIAVYVVVQRLPLRIIEMALKFGCTIYFKTGSSELRQLPLEHVAGVHFDRLIGTRVHGVTHDNSHAIRPAGHSKTR